MIFGVRKVIFSWFPNRQNWSPTDKTGPQLTKTSKSQFPGGNERHGPECRLRKSANAVAMSPHWPESSLVAGSNTCPPEKNPVNRELPGKLVNTTQRRQCEKVAQCKRGSDQPRISRKLPPDRWRQVTAKTPISGPQRGRKIFLRPPHTPKTSKSRIAGKIGKHTQRRQREKVAQCKRGSNEPKISRNSPVAPSYDQNGHFGPPTGPRNLSKSPRPPRNQ